jgi:hypothetical protein
MTKYPTLDEARVAGLFHCNCRHSISLYQEGITRPMHNTEDPEGYAQSQRIRYYEARKTQEKRRQAAAFTPDAKKASAQRMRAIDAALALSTLPAATEDTEKGHDAVD